MLELWRDNYEHSDRYQNAIWFRYNYLSRANSETISDSTLITLVLNIAHNHDPTKLNVYKHTKQFSDRQLFVHNH